MADDEAGQAAGSKVSPYDLQGVSQTVPSPSNVLAPATAVQPRDPYDLSRTQVVSRKDGR